MADIFQEVDEELRQDRANKLWKQYGAYVIALAVAIVVAIGGYRFWQDYTRKQAEERSAGYEVAIQMAAANNTTAAIEALAKLAEDGGAGYGTLARLRQAAIAAEQGDAEGAVLMYDKVTGDDSAPGLYRDLARLLAVMHAMDSTDQATLVSKLEPLLVAGNAWRPLAAEVTAVLAIKSGDLAAARKTLGALADDARAPARLRARATETLKAIGG